MVQGFEVQGFGCRNGGLLGMGFRKRDLGVRGPVVSV